MNDKPNIVFIMVDQLAAPFLAAYGHKVVKTPHIDKLASNEHPGGPIPEVRQVIAEATAAARAATISSAIWSRLSISHR